MRVHGNVASRRRRKRFLKKAKGFWGARSRLIIQARNTVIRSEDFAFDHRRRRRRDFRRLWITRLNAAARQHGITYSRLIEGLNKASVKVNRKQLSEMAIHEPGAFAEIVGLAKQAM